jgi:hypothetical protein
LYATGDLSNFGALQSSLPATRGWLDGARPACPFSAA